MSQVLQVLEGFRNLDFSDFRIFWPPKMTSTRSKKAIEDDDYGEIYVEIIDNFYLNINDIIKLDVS